MWMEAVCLDSSQAIVVRRDLRCVLTFGPAPPSRLPLAPPPGGPPGQLAGHCEFLWLARGPTASLSTELGMGSGKGSVNACRSDVEAQPA